jgi:hypothetical protein
LVLDNHALRVTSSSLSLPPSSLPSPSLISSSLLLLLIGAMYTFVFMWTPALKTVEESIAEAEGRELKVSSSSSTTLLLLSSSLTTLLLLSSSSLSSSSSS